MKNNKTIKDVYQSEIKNPDDLIEFMFKHYSNGKENVDDNANAVIIEKMAEFGFDTEE